ncbi:hypothetical protein EAI28_07615 [Faecalicatena contorta]|uniref:hypothetical protein n=1 Tax=Faecalicatena contorta TaxID=39482 RepID=UPI00129EE1CB|nr:hypothetical protein [Faecalicatena contorta]MRM88226.1 hypothetical protein [Faecalicatena contorta]
MDSFPAIPSLTWHCHDPAFEFSIPAQGTFSALGENYPFSGREVFLSRPDEFHGTNQVPVTTRESFIGSILASPQAFY